MEAGLGVLERQFHTRAVHDPKSGWVDQVGPDLSAMRGILKAPKVRAAQIQGSGSQSEIGDIWINRGWC